MSTAVDISSVRDRPHYQHGIINCGIMRDNTSNVTPRCYKQRIYKIEGHTYEFT